MGLEKERDCLLEAYGIKTLRIKNTEIEKNFRNACSKVEAEINKQIINK